VGTGFLDCMLPVGLHQCRHQVVHPVDAGVIVEAHPADAAHAAHAAVVEVHHMAGTDLEGGLEGDIAHSLVVVDIVDHMAVVVPRTVDIALRIVVGGLHMAVGGLHMVPVLHIVGVVARRAHRVRLVHRMGAVDHRKADLVVGGIVVEQCLGVLLRPSRRKIYQWRPSSICNTNSVL